MTRQRLTSADIGARMFKCNSGSVWDYFAKTTRLAVPVGVPYPSDWSMGDTYRNSVIRDAGPKPVLLWVTGSASAVHEVGITAGTTYKGTIDEDYLIDLSLADVDVEFAEYTGVRLTRPVDRSGFLHDPVLKLSEPIRAPKMTNPSFLTATELTAAVKYFRPDDLRAAGWDRLGLVRAKP